MLSGADSQIAAFVAGQPILPTEQDGTSARVVFKTALELNRVQEDWLTQYALARKQSLEKDSGRDLIKNSDWWSGLDAEQGRDGIMSFMGKRALMDLVYEQNLEWRKVLWGGIYAAGQNVHLPLSRRICQQMVARGNGYFFGSDPFFAAAPIGVQDAQLADSVDKYLKWKIEQGGIKNDLSKAVELAFRRGECVVKTRHWTDAVYYDAFAKVAVDGPGGKPLVASDNDYIYSTDKWVLKPLVNSTEQLPVMGQTSNPADIATTLPAAGGVAPAPEQSPDRTLGPLPDGAQQGSPAAVHSPIADTGTQTASDQANSVAENVPRGTINDGKAEATMPEMRGTPPTEGAALPDLPVNRQTQGQGTSVGEARTEVGQIGAPPMPGVRQPQGGNAPSGLQQGADSQMAMPSMPQQASQGNQVETGPGYAPASRPQLANPQGQAQGLPGQMVQSPPGANPVYTDAPPPVPTVMVLDRDPMTRMPDGGLIFERRKVRRRVTRYSGPEAKPIFYKDFLAPLNAPDLQSADCCIHLYDIPAIELVGLYIERLKAQDDFDPKELPRVMELLRTAPTTQGSSEAQASRPRPELREGYSVSNLENRQEGVLNIGEFYLRVQIPGTNQMSDVYLMLDLITNQPIIYDHVANIWPDAKRPFHVIRINPVDGRWHGVGIMEIFWELQKFADLSMNRWDLSQSQSGKVIFWHPESTVQGDTNPELELNCGTTYRKKDAKTQTKDILDVVPLQDFKGASLEKIIEFVTQVMTNMSGVANVNDASMAGLDTSKLATGVRNMDRSGAELFAPYISHLEVGITSVMEACLALSLWHASPTETFHVLDGGNAQLMTISADQIRDLEFDVRLELTKYKNEQMVAEAQSAKATVLEYYGLAPELQMRTAPFFRNILKGFQVPNVDAVLQPLPYAIQSAPTEQPPMNKSTGEYGGAGTIQPNY